MGDHLCVAHECPVRIPPMQFMCTHHWEMLSPELQHSVWVARTLGGKHIDAAMAAVDYVWTLESEAEYAGGTF